ncbi:MULTISPECIES: DUF805 domain-containing protein [unclassified Novosphingobium]|uniref:DUF805 domain-containing protein n=1 Tax=unclassified Novosphingobium TaxID=2644732 RepID=UPI0006B908FC|nr:MULTISPECIES: DUF805 domain-containing protein [unclassified Novosphingobium]MBB3650872.1 uncharacterized membrane protein YhaH (DUF805 family) [Novosphingobium sp. BK626]PTR12346.1 uncharacterized membrane protein YhaH (DUF805 family) [Novosphingobium sp. GV055]MBB3356662.1 uncharacterized membrane protein YhaH (DUF805 family) [Novosphingobium sp. BK256]MBB3373063.1 uncharacterized membrane protein YhaH (DUF805 family) [Novosphingobium sp. BK280]MBB3377431.1 uncharacterized membrane protei
MGVFVYWLILPYRRMFEFRGRSRRREFFSLVLSGIAVFLLFFSVFMPVHLWDKAAAPETNRWDIVAISGMAILVLVWAWAHMAVCIRRFHDQDRTGWLYLISFVPYVGGLIVFVMMFLPGTPGPNRYGADPKNRDLTDVFG